MGGYPSISPTWSTTMGLELVSPGKNPPEEINVIIEIPKDFRSR